MIHLRLFGFSIQTLLSLVMVLTLALIALAIDLSNDGPTDELLWHLTGETEPLEQLLGGTQYLANGTRQMPDTAPNTSIQHIPNNRFGINAFLELEAEATKRRQSMALIADAGFGWLRQHFPWEDIEIYGKGVFWDERNRDINRVGGGHIRLDTYSTWEKYDNIVNLAEEYGVNILARVSSPTPVWALPAGTTNTHGPPSNYQDFVDYAVTVATRYKGRIQHYQIWNEPNLYPEWGDQLIDPAGYTQLLCATYAALKAVDPNIVVHTGAIGPTVDMTGRDAFDLLYLQRLYDLGAGDCFDVLSVQGYGLFSGPTDRRLRPYTMNFARHQWLRDIMVANGDAEKPIWISEAGWNPVPTNPDIEGIETYGQVTPDQAAEWAPLAYERAFEEWPWIGVINYWFLKRPSEAERNQAFYYFRLVEPTWEPTAVYYSLQDYIQSGDWQHPEDGWERRARELVPQVLIGALAILFAGFILSRAIILRVLPLKERSSD
ncbi:MAG: hypothetical protein GYB66_05250 [Chloroflexi bacterium]|nr:hypothetical protein [Chloroflexota bacterium]